MKLLLIAGMGESVALAQNLSAIEGVEVVMVPEGRAVARADPPVRVHTGRFASDGAFAQFLKAEAFDLVIDAAHPFQFTLGRVARASACAYLRASRALWPRQSHWHCAPTIETAVAALPHGARVFTATGRGTLPWFHTRPEVVVFCRQLQHHSLPFPLPNGQFIFGAGPFTMEQEVETFQRLGITHLLLRNGGSIAGRSKLDAAEAMGLGIVMITPPNWQIDADQRMLFQDIPNHVRAHAHH